MRTFSTDELSPPVEKIDRTADPQAEKPTKALVGVTLLIAIGFAMYGLGSGQQAEGPSQVAAHTAPR